MPAYKVAIARPTNNGWERIEVGNLLGAACRAVVADPQLAPQIMDLELMSMERFPTDAARNAIIDYCQKKRIDFVLMVDTDASPALGTFEGLLTFLLAQKEPSVVGVPYVSRDGAIQVFRMERDQVHPDLNASYSLRRYTKDEASVQKGFGRVSAVGTHVMMIDLRVLERLHKPYFAYGYSPDGVEVKETEDCNFCRRVSLLGVPIYCAWDFKAGHYKELKLEVPGPVPPEMLPALVQDMKEVVDNQTREVNRLNGVPSPVGV